MFSGIFFLLSVYTWFSDSDNFVIFGYLVVSIVLILISVIYPDVLAPLNRAWFKLGEIMGKIVSPIVLGVIFFILITPVAMLTRLFGRDELRLKKRAIESYWIERNPPGPASDSFKNQF